MLSFSFLCFIFIFLALPPCSFQEEIAELDQSSNWCAREEKWWEKMVLYQAYPRSIQDNDGDGVGDLVGLASRLGFMASIDMGAVWLNPISRSPMKDFGYDVSAYSAIDSLFGTADEFEELVLTAHSLGLGVIVDLVPNHSSDLHPWFVLSRGMGTLSFSSLSGDRDGKESHSVESQKNDYCVKEGWLRGSKCGGLEVNETEDYRDFYVWADPKEDGGPPNNWTSAFGGSAWEWVEERSQYYYHKYLKEQPDLNLRNPVVKKKFMEIMDIWMGVGVDGFRIDAAISFVEDEMLRDEPFNVDWDGVNEREMLNHIYTENLPETLDVLAEFRRHVDLWNREVNPEKEVFLYCEVSLPWEESIKYYGTESNPICHLPTNFALSKLPTFSAYEVSEAVIEAEQYTSSSPFLTTWVLGSHDFHRIASRTSRPISKIAHLLLLTLRGVPTLYYGDEIGMINGDIPFEEMKDPQALNNPELAKLGLAGRDPERTPMQWSPDVETAAGFLPPCLEEQGCSFEDPWLPINDDFKTFNVLTESQDSADSFFNFIHSVLELRSLESTLRTGALIPVPDSSPSVFSYLRVQFLCSGSELDGGLLVSVFLVVLNFDDQCSVSTTLETLQVIKKIAEVLEEKPDMASPLSELLKMTRGSIELNTHEGQDTRKKASSHSLSRVELDPAQGLVIRLETGNELPSVGEHDSHGMIVAVVVSVVFLSFIAGMAFYIGFQARRRELQSQSGFQE